MIRYYCQYSYGGFRTFRIMGEKHESLHLEVTTENDQELPQLADLYFNRGGAKILYRFLDPETLALVVREIPSLGTDTDNRRINSAVLFIGDKEDKDTLDLLTVRIANNLHEFEEDFADMFDLRGGLHFEGDRLAKYVEECSGDYGFDDKGSELLDVIGREGEILLFVPTSENFGYKSDVTQKTLNELQLPLETVKKQRFINLSRLMKIQYQCQPVVKKKAETVTRDIGGATDNHEDVREQLEESQKRLAEKEKECDGLRSSAISTSNELKNIREQYGTLQEKSKKMLLIGAAVLGGSLLLNLIQFFFFEDKRRS